MRVRGGGARLGKTIGSAVAPYIIVLLGLVLHLSFHLA